MSSRLRALAPVALAALFGFMGWKVARGRRQPLLLPNLSARD